MAAYNKISCLRSAKEHAKNLIDKQRNQPVKPCCSSSLGLQGRLIGIQDTIKKRLNILYMGLIAKGQDLQPCPTVVSGLPARRRSGEQGPTMRGGKRWRRSREFRLRGSPVARVLGMAGIGAGNGSGDLYSSGGSSSFYSKPTW